MDLLKDYAYVVAGKKRSEALRLLAFPKTPTELKKLMHVHANVITRILQDLSKKELIKEHRLQPKRKTYMLTKRGELARKLLENLIEPRTFQELVKLIHAHRAIVSAMLKQLLKSGFVTIFKTLKPARKFYQLTSKGEQIRLKLEKG